MIKIGDWVTQYSAGYWQVIGIYPKYADEDYTGNGKSWKKGDRLGDWVVLKKGFTPKMKPSNRCEVVDSFWCKEVSPEINAKIEAAFSANPKALNKFINASNTPDPAVASVWMDITEEQAAELTQLLQALPERFTSEQLWQAAPAYRQYITNPGAPYILYIFLNCWEMTDTFDNLYFGPIVKKFEE